MQRLLALNPVPRAATLIIRQLIILIPNNNALFHSITALGCWIEGISPSWTCGVVAIWYEQRPVRSEGESAGGVLVPHLYLQSPFSDIEAQLQILPPS